MEMKTVFFQRKIGKPVESQIPWQSSEISFAFEVVKILFRLLLSHF